MVPMSDIPVGSPPAPPGRHAAASGWYPDPLDGRQERYWDGWQWSRTTRVREGGPAAPPSWPAGPPPQQVPGYGQSAATPYAPPVAAARPGLRTADGVPVASWWWRVLAALLDGLFTGVVGVLLSLPFLRDMFTALSAFWTEAVRAAQAGQPPPPTPEVSGLVSTADQVLIGLIALVVGLAYHVIFLRLRGATPGKQICGLRVVPVDRGLDRGALAWGSVLVRALVWVVPGVWSPLFLVTVADVLLPLWHPRRQALHDLAAGTQVVRPRG
jgi:uncharacterized RDD family membrane protein YckC